MSRAYEYSAVIEKKVLGHLRSLGYSTANPPKAMKTKHKLSVLNYVRTVKTAMEVIELALLETPLTKEGE